MDRLDWVNQVLSTPKRLDQFMAQATKRYLRERVLAYAEWRRRQGKV